jgi:hypothetical protein
LLPKLRGVPLSPRVSIGTFGSSLVNTTETFEGMASLLQLFIVPCGSMRAQLMDSVTSLSAKTYVSFGNLPATKTEKRKPRLLASLLDSEAEGQDVIRQLIPFFAAARVADPDMDIEVLCPSRRRGAVQRLVAKLLPLTEIAITDVDHESDLDTIMRPGDIFSCLGKSDNLPMGLLTAAMSGLAIFVKSQRASHKEFVQLNCAQGLVVESIISGEAVEWIRNRKVATEPRKARKKAAGEKDLVDTLKRLVERSRLGQIAESMRSNYFR